MNDAAAAQPYPFETHGHGESRGDLQPHFGEPRAITVDVTATDRVPDLEPSEQHCEEYCRGLDDACRNVVATLAQQISAEPEGCRRNAVTIEQPVENRRRSDVVADDARLVADAQKAFQPVWEQTKGNDRLTLYFCMNYGGRAEIADAAQAMAEDVKAGRLDPSKVNEKTLAKYLYYPDMPDVDLFLRPSGEQRTSNYLIWQSAYAEMVFQDVLWPDFDRRDLWRACVEYASRDRRFGGAIPNEELLAMEGKQA